MGGAQCAAPSKNRGNNHEVPMRRNQSRGNTLHGNHNRSCAQQFRKNNEYTRVIELIDVNGNCTRVKSRGKMNNIDHQRVLKNLAQ
jgi:hypothetical protein